MADIQVGALVLRLVLPLCPAAVSIGYVAAFIRGERAGWAKPAAALGVALHAALLVLVSLQRGHFPTTTVFEGLAFCGFVLSLLYLGLERIVRESA